MSKLIPLEEAAKFLGLSVDRLNELRENNEVFGYRDGTTWKFKLSELERVAGQSGIDISGAGGLADAASSVVGDVKDALGFGSGADDSKEDLIDESGDLSFEIDDPESELVIDDDDDDSIALEDSSLELFKPAGANAGSGASSDILSLDEEENVSDSMVLKDSSIEKLEPQGASPGSGTGSDILSLAEEDDSDSLSLEDSSLELFQSPGADAAAGTSSDILSLDDDDDDDLIDLAKSGLLVKGGSKESVLEDSGDDELSLASSGLDLASDEDELGLASDEDELSLASDDSELSLASADDFELESDKELNLDEVGSFTLSDDASVLDDDDDELSFGSSSLVLASDSVKSSGPGSTGGDLLAEEGEPSGSPSTGKLLAGDDDDDLMLANDDLDLELADSGSFDSELSSSLDQSGELVLEDESSDDLILEANESGIALSPNESGIMLGDEPLELGGSDIDDLELPEDDDIIMVDDEADPEMATMMQEDDFSLTPHELSMDDDDSSGSQVIALADSEIYADDSEATMLGSGGDFSDPAMLDEGGLEASYDPAAGMVAAGAAGAAYGVAGAKPEAPYSWGQIISLFGTTVSLFIGCIVAYGMAQNLWMPDDQVVNSGLMNLLLDTFGLKS